jgi:hypothetical protein
LLSKQSGKEVDKLGFSFRAKDSVALCPGMIYGSCWGAKYNFDIFALILCLALNFIFLPHCHSSG